MIPHALSETQRAVLRQMARYPHADAGELVAEGWHVYLGDTRHHARTVTALLRCAAISETENGGRTRRYRINATGRALRRNEAKTLARFRRLTHEGVACG